MLEGQALEFKSPQKEVIFTTRYLNYQLSIAPESRIVQSDGSFLVTDSGCIQFTNGIFKTDDPGIIAKIRNSAPFKVKEIQEITERDKNLFKPKGMESVRGSITTKTLGEEVGADVEEKLEGKVKLGEKGVSKCDICGKVFAGDLLGRKLRMHKIGSHRTRPETKKAKK